MVIRASSVISVFNQSLLNTGATVTRRSNSTNTANLLTVARKMVAGAGPPWYTSGVQR